MEPVMDLVHHGLNIVIQHMAVWLFSVLTVCVYIYICTIHVCFLPNVVNSVIETSMVIYSLTYVIIPLCVDSALYYLLYLLFTIVNAVVMSNFEHGSPFTLDWSGGGRLIKAQTWDKGEMWRTRGWPLSSSWGLRAAPEKGLFPQTCAGPSSDGH